MEPITFAPFGTTHPDTGANTFTKREAIAIAAMTAMCRTFPEMGNSHAPLIARQAVEIADRLIEALNK